MLASPASFKDPLATHSLRGRRPQVLTPGSNRKVTVLGAIEVSTGRWVYRLGRRCAADFIALLDQVLRAYYPVTGWTTKSSFTVTVK